MRGDAVLDYHERTKHSYESVRLHGAGLDWSNEPAPFKDYVDIEPVPLPRFERSGVSAHEAIARSANPSGAGRLNAALLSHVLFHAAGVSRVLRGSFGTLHLRTYASAGALYPNELYAVVGDVEGVDAGVYHYAPKEHGLRLLRRADHRGSLGLASASPGAVTVVVSGIPWRTAWKYGPRGYRHLYWDAGMIVANLLAAAAATGVRARLLLGFVDADVDRLVGVDGDTEFALCAVALGDGTVPTSDNVEPLSPRVAPLSRRPKRDPLIEETHRATVMQNRDDVEAFGDARRSRSDAASEAPATSEMTPLPRDRLSADPFETVVRRRGSSRQLERDSFPAAEFAAVQDAALGGLPSDWDAGGVGVSVIASALEGLAQGAYGYRARGRFRGVRDGDLRRKAGFLCLEQRLGADAAASVFLMADLEEVVSRLGPRGYPAALLEAAIVAGRMYLGAYAQCLGATGITFYDDEVRRLFDTSAEPMLSVVIGPEGRRASIIRCRERVTQGP